MDIHQTLAELGLSDGEIKVYLALLKLGSSPVSKVKEETTLHRTTIYDFVEKLLNKGLINYIVKSGVKYYNATDPVKLLEFLKEKQRKLEKILPELEKLAKFQQEEVSVEVYKGKEGLKTILADTIKQSLKSNKEIIGMGVDDGYWKKNLPVYIEQFQRMLKENNIQERILTKRNSDYYFDQKQTNYRYLSKDLFSPLSTLVYGDKIQIAVWEPSIMSVVIKSKVLAKAYKKHFEGLWNQSSMMFKGIDEIKDIFWDIARTLKKGEEYTVFGIPPASDIYTPFFDEIMDRLAEKKVVCRGIFDERAKEQIKSAKRNPGFQVKVMGKDHMSPAEVGIYGNKIAIILWTQEPEAFVIDNKNIALSFRQYFEVLWNTAR